LAITDAILFYQKERFRFNETTMSAPPTFSTVAQRAVYTSADNANIGSNFNIDFVNAQIGNYLQYLQRDTPENLIIFNQINTMFGQPFWYGYRANELILSPVPDQAYVITLGLFNRVAAPASDAETDNPWMIDAERLIRARAKYEIAMHVTRNPTMAMAMSPSPPSENNGTVGAAWREWKSLKSEANRVQSLGRIRAMAF